MSIRLYWYKPPSERKELGSSYNLKWPLAYRYGQYGGTLPEEYTLTGEDIPFLEGLEASERYPEVTALIASIREHGSVEVELR